MTKVTQTLVPEVSGGTEPTILRARYVKQVVRAVNQNTLAIGPPRPANSNISDERLRLEAQGKTGLTTDVEDLADGPGQVEVFRETSRTTSTVRVTNPDDEEQYVDVLRIESVRLMSADGRVMVLEFSNSSE